MFSEFLILVFSVLFFCRPCFSLISSFPNGVPPPLVTPYHVTTIHQSEQSCLLAAGHVEEYLKYGASYYTKQVFFLVFLQETTLSPWGMNTWIYSLQRYCCRPPFSGINWYKSPSMWKSLSRPYFSVSEHCNWLANSNWRGNKLYTHISSSATSVLH